MTKKEAEKRIAKALSVLAKRFGAPRRPVPGEEPLDTLLFLVLLDGASERRAERAFRHMGELFVDWNELRVSSPLEIEEAIAGVEDARTKARRIGALLNGIFDRQNQLSLAGLLGMDAKELESFLTNIEGMTWADAAQLLFVQFERPVLPVDEDIVRVAMRLGVCGDASNVEEVRKAIESIVPKKKYWECFRLFKLHAATTCVLQDYACGKCPLAAQCETGLAVREAEAAAKKAKSTKSTKTAKKAKKAGAAKPRTARPKSTRSNAARTKTRKAAKRSH